MAFPSLPPSGLQISRTALLFLWILGGVHYGTCLSLHTPAALVECEMADLTWEGQAPFTIYIRFHNDSLLEEFTNLTGSALSWQVKAPAGSLLYLEIMDSSHNKTQAVTDEFAIQSGNDTTCLQSSKSTANSATTAAVTSTTSPSGSITSLMPLPSGSGLSRPSTNTSVGIITIGEITGIAIASLITGLLIALGVWFIQKRRKHSSRSRSRSQWALDTHLSSDSGGIGLGSTRDPEMHMSDFQTVRNSSLAARTSSMSLNQSNGAENPGYSHQENAHEGVMSVKLLRELRNSNRSESTPGRRNGSQEMDQQAATAERLISLGQIGFSEQNRVLRYETDGGVRLAGGRPGEVPADEFDHHTVSENGSTLPPPYSSDFGDS